MTSGQLSTLRRNREWYWIARVCDLCVDCGRGALPGRALCFDHLERRRVLQAAYKRTPQADKTRALRDLPAYLRRFLDA